MGKCKNCGSEITTGEINRKKFCDRSCAAKFNNKKYPKRPSTDVKCPDCGGKKDYKASRCHKCKKRRKWEEVAKKPMSDFFLAGNARVKFSWVRKWGREVFKTSGKKMECEICGFDVIVHIDHIIELSAFDDNATMEEVTGIKNLQCLCPNHHAMKGKGLRY